MTDDYNLNEIFDGIQRYMDDDVWDRFLQDEFFKYPKDYRIAVMDGFNRLFAQEVKPNRTTAMWINRRREMEHMHLTLERGGR
jgi:hypothetical protein